MQAVAHNPAFAKKVGVPQSVGSEFTKGSSMKGESKIQKKAKKGAEMVKMNKGGKASCYAKGGGIEVKGKTKGKMIVMKGAK